MADQFNWDREENSSVIFQSVDALAVYSNECGEVVIRQESRMGDDDRAVFVPIGRIKDLIAALRKQVAKGRG